MTRACSPTFREAYRCWCDSYELGVQCRNIINGNVIRIPISSKPRSESVNTTAMSVNTTGRNPRCSCIGIKESLLRLSQNLPGAVTCMLGAGSHLATYLPDVGTQRGDQRTASTSPQIVLPTKQAQLTHQTGTTHPLNRHNSPTEQSQLTHQTVTTHPPNGHNSPTKRAQLTH